MHDTDARLFALAKRVVDPRRTEELTAESLLFEEKFLDSFGIIQLVTDIETEFAVAIPTEDLTFQNFGSVRDIARLVERYLSQAP